MRRPAVVFVFPGRGSHWPGMGLDLMAAEPVYRETVERFDRLFQNATGASILEILHAPASDPRWSDDDYIHPAIVALEAATVALWGARGVRPDAVIGHSLGESAAAYAAGALTEEQLVHVAVAFSRCDRLGEPGGAAVVGVGAERARRLAEAADGYLALAGRLGPSLSTLAGDVAALESVRTRVEAEEILYREVRSSFATHSALAAPGAEAFRRELADLRPRDGDATIVTAVTGAPVRGRDLDADHWAANLGGPADFQGAIEHVLADGPAAFVEVGPTALLRLGLQETVDASAHAASSAVVASAVRGRAGEETFRRAVEAVRPFVPVREERAARPSPSRPPSAAPLEPLAVIGIGCRLPGGIGGPDAFWEALLDGRETVAEVPPERWDHDAVFDPEPGVPGKAYARRAGFIDAVDRFDAGMFAMSPREAAAADPQQRVLLETIWEAIEHAGIAPDALAGTATGTFVGAGPSGALVLSLGDEFDEIGPYELPGLAVSVASGRPAYVLGLEGPAVSVDTACSASMTALHLASQSLRSGESDLALVAGSNVILTPGVHLLRSQSRMLSPRGRCASFDASADGFVPSEGCGVLVLKRLSDAERDGDRVLALVAASAANQDGRSAGLMAPSEAAQEAVARAALAAAGLDGRDVQAIEAHGTGTPVGDPTELRALQAVYGAEGRAPVLVGSAKANVGHCETAAGVVGLIKAVLSLHHGTVPPHPHLEAPTPAFDWEAGSLAVPTAATPWPATDGPRRIAVSSFGVSGTNVHAILQEAPPRPRRAVAPPAVSVLPLSARSAEGLDRLAERYVGFLDGVAEADWADVCATAAQGRAHFEHRLAVVAATPAEARDALVRFRDGDASGVVVGEAVPGGAPPAFLFSGQGAQAAGMGRELYDAEPTVRRVLDRCAEVAEGLLDRPLLSVMFGETEADAALLDQTAYTQPALYALEAALAELWRSWGVRPGAVLGHSIGELAAAFAAGAIGLEDGLRLVIERGRLMQALPGEAGRMAAVLAPEAEVRAAAERHGVSVAGLNGPEHVVVSGDRAAVDALAAELGAAGAVVRPLTVSHAFHSAHMDPMLGAFEAAVDAVGVGDPAVPLVSNVTGRPVAPGEIAAGAYWARHVREGVAFRAGMDALWARGHRAFVEIGPHTTLLGMGRACVHAGGAWAASLHRGQGDVRAVRTALAQLYVFGTPIDWAAAAPLGERRTLPTYPFDHSRRYPFGGREGAVRALIRRGTRTGDAGSRIHPLLGRPLTSPAFDGTLYETTLSAGDPSFLSDHRIYGTPLFPGAGMLEIFDAVARDLIGEAVEVRRVSVLQPLAFSEGAERVMQVVVEGERDGERRARIVSRPTDGDEWSEHATGVLAAAGPPSAPAIDASVDGLTAYDAAEYYAGSEEDGTALSGVFVNFDEIHVELGVRAVARLDLGADTDAGRYGAHPALLDGGLQVYAATLSAVQGGQTKVPVGFARYRLHQPGATAALAVARLHGHDEDGNATGSCAFLDSHGALVAEIEGVETRMVSHDAIRRLVREPVTDWMFGIGWEPPAAAAPGAPPGDGWTVLADREGVGEAVAERLRAAGAAVAVVHAAASPTGDGEARSVDAADPEAVERLVRAAHPNVLHLWMLDAEGATADALQGPLGSLVPVVRALAASDAPARRLAVVTRGAVATADGDAAPSPLQGAAWGLRRVARSEHSDLDSRAIDLDPALGPDAAADAVVLALGLPDEPEVAVRDGAPAVPRLRRHAPAPWPWTDGAPYTLDTPERGSLDRLALVPHARRAPEAGEVEIRVAATGLNFRDVLNALGMYPGDPGPLGGECAGHVVAVGPGVRHVAVGDRVVALANGAFRSFVTVPAAFAVRAPHGATLAEGATLPITFLTAHHGLHRLAGLRPGQRVLVHAAAGGVGMAAVQIALRAGAEVIGTAGSPEKRARVRAMGVRHVFDSRSASFADGVERVAGPRGVDVVLNALVGEFIPAGLRLLRDGGAFLELGKREIWTDEQVAAVAPGVRYLPYDLGDVMRDEPMAVFEMLGDVARAVEAGELRPLPVTPFPIRDAAAAFRFMAQARHTGKVVVTHPPAPDDDAPIVRPDATYVITGGLGSLGREVARRLAERGARHLVLLGRRDPSPDAQAVVDALRADGVAVRVARVDVADRDAVRALVAEIEAAGPPLRGVFHAAGVTDDAFLVDHTWPQTARVLAAKVDGAHHFHAATRGLDLDHFVLFSSVAGVFGAVGQGAYAAGNAALDALAARRRAEGLAALSVAWGPWAETGLAAQLDDAWHAQMRRRGLDSIPVEDGLDALEHLMRQAQRGAAPAVVVVQPMRLATAAASDYATPLFRALAAAVPRPAARRRGARDHDREFLSALDAAPAEERGALVVGELRARISRITQLDAADVPADASLMSVGLESLMAVEFKSQVESLFGATVSVGMLLQGASLTDVAEHVLAQRDDAASAAAAPAAAEAALARVDAMTEAELDAMLAEADGGDA